MYFDRIKAKEIMETNDVSIATVAHYSGISQNTIYKALSGKPVRSRTIAKITQAIDRSIGKVPIQSKAAG